MAKHKVFLVGDDERPKILMVLKDEHSGSIINVSSSTTTITLRVRLQGNRTASLFDVIATKPNGGTDGVVLFTFDSDDLTDREGLYEGEVKISYSGSVQTVYDTILFQIRKEFPAVA